MRSWYDLKCLKFPSKFFKNCMPTMLYHSRGKAQNQERFSIIIKIIWPLLGVGSICGYIIIILNALCSLQSWNHGLMCSHDCFPFFFPLIFFVFFYFFPFRTGLFNMILLMNPRYYAPSFPMDLMFFTYLLIDVHNLIMYGEPLFPRFFSLKI